MFDELIELCKSRDDRFHLAAALGNRAWLWSARGELEQSADGHCAPSSSSRARAASAHLERIATHNLAEIWLWQGTLDEALQLARRSLALQQSYGESSTRFDLMLVARILAAKDEPGELAATLAQIERGELDDDERIMLRALLAAQQRAELATWNEILVESATLSAPFRIEIGLLASRRGRLAAPHRDEILALAYKEPLFAHRVSEI